MAIEKRERRLGTRLFLKAERCGSPKCALIRRPYPPGAHGRSRRRQPSELSKKLQEKQKLQLIYGLNERQMQNLFHDLLGKKIKTGEQAVKILEKRLDNAVFRLGLAPSRRVARQLVSHGHILLDGKKVTIPSRLLKKGNVVSLRPQSLKMRVFEDLETRLKKLEAPKWLNLDKDNKRGEVASEPDEEPKNMPFDINLVAEYYSK